MRKLGLFLLFTITGLAIIGCTFDYGSEEETDRPDIVMEKIEYVRVRGGDPLVRFQAEHAERWEDLQLMDVNHFSFEQLGGEGGENLNARGGAGTARVELDTGDVALRGGVTVRIESEDIVIRTDELDWNDDDRILSGRPEDEVEMERPDGTLFTGTGFSADMRNRTWGFSGEVKGTYVETDEEEENE